MMRNRTYAGLVVLAIFVTGSLAASAAQAEQSYRFSTSPTTVSSSQVAKNKLHIPGAGTAECVSVNLGGAITGTAINAIELHPEFSGCSAFGFPEAHIITTGCNFRFATPVKNKANVALECSGTNKIKITPTLVGASICTLELPPQTFGGVVDLENNAGKTDVLMRLTLTKIHHGPACGVPTAADGELTGSLTAVGNNSFWVE
jgi:hypothetical protein